MILALPNEVCPNNDRLFSFFLACSFDPRNKSAKQLKVPASAVTETKPRTTVISQMSIFSRSLVASRYRNRIRHKRNLIINIIYYKSIFYQLSGPRLFLSCNFSSFLSLFGCLKAQHNEIMNESPPKTRKKENIHTTSLDCDKESKIKGCQQSKGPNAMVLYEIYEKSKKPLPSYIHRAPCCENLFKQAFLVWSIKVIITPLCCSRG